MTQKNNNIIINNIGEIKLNKLIKKEYPNISFSLLNKLVRTGQIRLNGSRVKLDSIVNIGDQIRLPPNILNKDLSPNIVHQVPKQSIEDFYKWVIYEDDDLIVINKPSGISVQCGSDITHSVDSIIKTINKDYNLAHRIDKDTSGILLIAKNYLSTKYLTQLFREKKVEKEYLALTQGTKIKFKKEFIINAPILKDKSKVFIDYQNGKEALTKFKVLASHDNYNLLLCSPQTGRTHQIRVHLSNSLNNPIIGDIKYGTQITDIRLLLHAYSIKFLSKSGLKMQFRADLDTEFNNFLEDKGLLSGLNKV